VKLHFINSKLREKHFSTENILAKQEISKSTLNLPTPIKKRGKSHIFARYVLSLLAVDIKQCC